MQKTSQKSICGQWIPVSERLPGKNGNSMVTFARRRWPKNRFVTDGIFVGELDGKSVQKWCIHEGGRDQWIGLDHKRIQILAWMPYPDPYQEESVTA